MAALELSKGRDVQYAAGLALALSGDSAQSEALAGDLEKRFPEDTFVKFTYAPVLRALAALEQRKPADSVERLQIALPYELAVNGLNFQSFLSWRFALGLCARRGFHCRAPVSRKRRPSFRRFSIIAVSWGCDPIGALAHLQLGQSVRFIGRYGQGESCL